MRRHAVAANSLGVLLASLAVLPPRVALADEAACVAAAEQSLSLRKQGKLHGALKQLAVCADSSCPDEVKAECARRIDAATAAMPTLILAARDGAGNDLYAVTVSMDGAPLVPNLDGRPVSIDPGPHTFRFEAPGVPPVDKELVLREGEKNRRESAVIAPAPVAPSSPVQHASPPPSSWSTQKTLAVVSAAVGVVGLGLGVDFGVYASSAQSKEKTDCSPGVCANRAQATEDYDTAKKDATGSTIAFVAGAALVGAGVTLWLLAPKASGSSAAASARAVHLAPAVFASGGGLSIGGEL